MCQCAVVVVELQESACGYKPKWPHTPCGDRSSSASGHSVGGQFRQKARCWRSSAPRSAIPAGRRRECLTGRRSAVELLAPGGRIPRPSSRTVDYPLLPEPAPVTSRRALSWQPLWRAVSDRARIWELLCNAEDFPQALSPPWPHCPQSPWAGSPLTPAPPRRTVPVRYTRNKRPAEVWLAPPRA